MSLKARLTLAVVAIVALATLALAGVILQRTEISLIDQVDDRLVASLERLPRREGPGSGPDAPVLDEDRHRETAEIIADRSGRIRVLARAGFPDAPDPLPHITAGDIPRLRAGIVTVPAQQGDLRYRATALPLRTGAVRILAASMADVDDSMQALRRTLLLGGLVVVLGAAVASWLVVRGGLRPVDRMVVTAGAIAAGDLSQRVDQAPDGTELGRLANALDEMMGQIEAAFAEREASEARLRRFVSDASHELRTPVSSIRGYAELYRQGGVAPGSDTERAMDRIETESTRMGRLVEDLLELARLDQHQPMAHERVNLSRIVTDLAADVASMEPERPLRVEVADDVVVTGDEHRLHQVVANLVGNARVHTPPAAPLSLLLRAEGDQAVLEVADGGPGIPADHLDRVFERFYRVDPSRTRATGGSGLGLSIVAGIVEAHGGHVTGSSNPGAGATFTVRLPLAR